MTELLHREETGRLIGFCMEIHRELGKGHDELIDKNPCQFVESVSKIPASK
jgi:hypothetical protein